MGTCNYDSSTNTAECDCSAGCYADDCSLVCGGTLSWIGDGYCDDSLNTLECNFDDGDCCNKVANWADYCTVSFAYAECLRVVYILDLYSVIMP